MIGWFVSAAQRSEDHEAGGPPEHREAVRGDRGAQLHVPHHGVREWGGGVRLPRRPWPHEGEGGPSQVPTNRIRHPVLPRKENYSQRLEGYNYLSNTLFGSFLPPPPPNFYFWKIIVKIL